MKLMSQPNFSFHRHQQGAALVVAMIMLIMVSLLAAASYMFSTTEARGAAGWSDRQRAMFAAEGALKEAVVAVQTIASSNNMRIAMAGKGTGYYMRHEVTVPDVAGTWSTSNSVQAAAADSRITDVFYMVVYEGKAPQSGQAFQDGTGGINKTAVRPRFTIYAKAGGLKDGTLVVLSTSKEF